MSDISPTLPADELTNPYRLWQTAAYYASFVILGLISASFGPILPYLANQTHSQLSQVSYLFALHSLGYLIGSLRGGQLFDQRSGHPILAVVLLIIAACLSVIPAIPILIPLLMVFFIVGLGQGSLDVGGNTLIIWAYGSKVGPFMNGLHFFFGVGAFLAPILVAQAMNLTGGFGGAYWLIALLILPVTFAFTRIKSPINRAAAAQAGQQPYKRWLVYLLVFFFFLYVGAEAGFGGWAFTYATRMNLADETTAAYITSAFWGALTIGRLLGVPISTRLQPKSILWIDLIGCLVSISLVVIFPGVVPAFWTGAILLGFFMASIFPTALTLAEKRLHISGRITSLFFVGASLGGMVLPWVIGQVFEPLGPSVAMWLIFGDILLSILLFALIK